MSLEELLTEFLDPDKRPTAQQLIELSDLEREDVVRLVEGWEDIDPERRLHIVTELAELALDNVDLNFDAVYKAALRDDDGRVRASALRGLLEYEGVDLIPVASELLREDPEEEVRSEAAITLGRYALEAELGHLSDADLARVRDVLFESAEDLEESEHVRAKAIEALGAISGEEIENLIESIYEEESMWLKVGAIDAMGRNANEVWTPTILREAQNPAPEMRHAAAFALGEIGEDSAVPLLKRMAIEDPDREVQLAAIHSLGEIGGSRARVALKSVLYEGDDSLEEAVQEAMAVIEFDENPMRPGGI